MNKLTNNIIWHPTLVTRKDRERLHKHPSFVLWFTGLPASGKSTVAHSLEQELFKKGLSTYVFDGDNIRHGLCADLGFSLEDRKENMRRIGHMCNLFIDAGIIVITAFVSPLRIHRQLVKDIIGENNFIEIYCKCPLEVCEQRDIKGHYKKAREGLIKEFTGISSPYEEPENPALVIETNVYNVGQSVEKLINFLYLHLKMG